MPERPKIKRRRDKDKIKKIGKLYKSGRIMTCGVCKEVGHNIRSCPKRTADM